MEEALFYVERNGKVGFINNAGQVVIDFQFDGASEFSEGIARVYHNDKVGCIDTEGKLVIPIQYESMSYFSEGLAVIEVNDKKGYINKAGEVVIPPRFYQAYGFQNGFALVREDMFSRGSFVNTKGETVLTQRVSPVSVYNEGLINCTENEKWGYMDITGELIIQPAFAYARPFYEGKAAVQVASPEDRHDGPLYGFIDKKGETVIPPIYHGADLQFSEDLCAVFKNGFGYIDISGELVIPYQFQLAEHFSEGMACVQMVKTHKYGFINKSGSLITKPIFDSADSFENGLAAVYLGKDFGKTRSGYINKGGDYVWEPSR